MSQCSVDWNETAVRSFTRQLSPSHVSISRRIALKTHKDNASKNDMSHVYADGISEKLRSADRCARHP